MMGRQAERLAVIRGWAPLTSWQRGVTGFINSSWQRSDVSMTASLC